jgi:hypothetical protein
MPFNLIKGTFHVVGYQPDGDSIRFQADRRENWALLSGPALVNAQWHVQLRIEAIDTLETHYKNGGYHHQPIEFARPALDFLLAELGITQVKFNAAGIQIISALDGTRGYILARTTEENGRPVAFVFAGDAEEADGAKIFLDADRMEDSVNYKLALAGLTYPTYYTGLFPDLRDRITSAVAQARQDGGIGIWPRDKTTTGFAVSSLESVTDHEVILPKLFRRIMDYMGHGGTIEGFKEYLAAHPDPVLVLPTGHFTNLDTLVEVMGQQVRLTIEPENLVFIG